MYNYIKQVNGTLISPRVCAINLADTDVWGEGNFVLVDIPDGFDPACYSDTLVNGLVVVDDAKVQQITDDAATVQATIDHASARLIAFDALRASFDYSKTWDSVTVTERKIVSGNEPALTDADLGV